MKYILNYVSGHLKELIQQSTSKTHFFDRQLSYISYEYASVAPYIDWNLSIGCVIDKNGEVIKDSECYEWKENDLYYTAGHPICEHKTVIFLGFLVTVFGHAFTDNLRKIWFLNTDSCKELIDNGAELVYTTSWNLPLPTWMVEAFSLTGIDISKARMISTLTKFDTVVIPDNCIMASEKDRLFGKEYVRIIDHIKKKCSPDELNNFERVYFTRTRLKHNRDIGEKRLAKAFRKAGYTIVAPEELPLVAQIRIMQSCSFFASTEGSISHLTIFCKPGTNVTLINKAEYANSHQVMINEFADLNVTYVDAQHSSLTNSRFPWWGPFYLYPSKYFKAFFNIQHCYWPFFLRMDYWYYLLIHSRMIKMIKAIVYKIL